MRNLVKHVTRVVAAAAALLAADPGILGAREIEIDELTITGNGAREGRANAVPWSGVWWPFVDVELARGWNGGSADFNYDETAKRWNRADASKAVNDRSPLLKYDEYVRLSTGTDPQSALLECTGDEVHDFEHSVYGDRKKQYDDEGISYSWWGHCNGWCGAALMEREPIGPIEARGIRFEVADLKGLLSESFWGVESDFTGKRYNKPKAVYTEQREPGKALLAALDAGAPRPVAEYIAWYEKVWETTMTAAAKAAAKPEDFRDELELFESWYVRTYDEAYKDVLPDVFQRMLETVIGRKKLALVFDITANEQVWNHPAFAYTSNVTFKRNLSEGSTALKEWDVATTVWYATDGVSESIIGLSDFSKTYTYTLVTDASSGRVLRGEWTGSSIDNHPDFAWLPVNNPTGTDYGENYKLLYGKILEILPAAHRSADARAIDIVVNGIRASTRRGNDRTTTWAEPVPASGDVALTVAVASGRSVARVNWFEQTVNGSTQITASRAPLASLGQSTASPSFGVTARFSTSGKKFVLAYAYDASGRLIGIDEMALQYSVSGGGGTSGGGTGADDAFEPNNAKSAAASVAAGSYQNLKCNDDDWFKVTLASTGGLTVKIDFQHAEGDLDLVLEGPTGNQIAKSESTSNQETCTGSGLAAGTYYARVYGYNGARATYALTVTVAGQSSGGGGTSATDDAYEPNNTRAAAAPVAAGSFPGLKCNDDDWFKVTLAAAGSLTVKIDFRNAEGDLDLVLEGPTGNQIAKSDSTADSERVAGASLAAGTYYFHAYGYNGARAGYSLTVTVTQSSTGGGGSTGGGSTAGDDAFEPNNAASAAASIAAGSYPGLKCNDDDWFKVTLAAPGSLTVRIDFQNSEGDLDLLLQGPSGNQIALSQSTSNSEQVAGSSLAAGTYLFRVYGYGGARAGYSLTVTTTQSSSGGGGTATASTGSVTASVLNVRTGPGTTYPVVTTIAHGTVVTILQTSGTWYRVTFSGAPASDQLWVSRSYIQLN